jgi:hypothetical protein
MRSSKLPLLVSLYLLNAGIGTVVAVARKLPYLFGGPGDPATVAIDFPTKGTALSPPLTAMFLLAALTLLVLRKDRWGLVGVAAVCILAVPLTIGGVMEPIVWEPLLVALSLLGIGLPPLMIIFGVPEFVERWHANRPAPMGGSEATTTAWPK